MPFPKTTEFVAADCTFAPIVLCCHEVLTRVGNSGLAAGADRTQGFGRGMRPEMKGFEDGQIDGAPRRRRPRRLSELFGQLAGEAREHVSIAHIRDELGNRSFAPLLVLFAAFNLLPL